MERIIAVRLSRTTIAAATCAWLLAAGLAYSQTVTGTIIGAVTDESNAVLPGVTATITSPVLPGGPATAATDEQGRYRFPGLSPGTYTLTLSLQGFAEYAEEIRLTLGATVERNVTLKVGTVAETITVSGQSPMVDTRSVAVTATSTRETIENLPTIRTTVTDYVQVLPGAVASNPGAYNEQIQIMGSPSNEITYIHDGVVINHPRTGNTWQGGDIDSAEEIQTVPLGASAEFASAAGGVVNLVTKSGTNSFHGDATGYWKPDSLQTKPILLDCGCPDGKTGFTLQYMKDVTAHAGGPLIRDKLWYYGGFQVYEFSYSHPGSYPTEVPSSYWHRFPIKVTWQPTESLRVSQLLHLEWWGGYASGPTRRVTLEASTKAGPAHIHSYGGEVNKTFGNATVLTVRAGGWWEPNQYNGPVTSGNVVNSSHTDNLSGVVSQGIPDLSRQIMRRDAQSFKLERYVSGARTTQSIRFGLQLERAHGTLQSAFPNAAQYYDFGGAPDYALFRDPSVQGAAFSTQGVWAEDLLTLGNRTTMSFGLRFDRMVGTSPDEDAVDNRLEETGVTIEGLGKMFTWNVFAPRVGVNLKLTRDGRTVLRTTYGRAYRQILLNEFDLVHPGISSITEARYDPVTRGYTRIISVTNSRSNLAVDRDLSAPQADTFSIGIDRQLGGQLAMNASYVYKHGENLTGWRDIGGVYGQSTAVLPDGRTLTVFPLLNSPSARVFQRTNRPEAFDTYHGFVTSVTKRLSERWQAHANLTLSRSEGLRLTGNLGRDPNDFTNLEGRLNPTDRPVMFNANGSYDIPVIDVRVSASYQNLSHIPYAPQAFVQLPQGRRAINIEAPGAFRAPRIQLLYLRFNKIIRLPANRRLELIANVVNALQNKSYGNQFFTFNYFSPNYGQPIIYVQPRQLYMGARFNF